MLCFVWFLESFFSLSHPKSPGLGRVRSSLTSSQLLFRRGSPCDLFPPNKEYYTTPPSEQRAVLSCHRALSWCFLFCVNWPSHCTCEGWEGGDCLPCQSHLRLHKVMGTKGLTQCGIPQPLPSSLPHPLLMSLASKETCNNHSIQEPLGLERN